MTLLLLVVGILYGPVRLGERILVGMTSGELGQFLDSQGEKMRQWSASCREAWNRTIYYIGLLIVGALIPGWNRSHTPIQFLFVIMPLRQIFARLEKNGCFRRSPRSR